MQDLNEFKPKRGKVFDDYSFVALLYNIRKPDVLCLGAIITQRWIIDNCLETPG